MDITGRIIADAEAPSITGFVNRHLDARHVEVFWDGGDDAIECVSDLIVIG